MGPPLYVRSVVERNVVMWRMTVLVTNYKCMLCNIPEEESSHDY